MKYERVGISVVSALVLLVVVLSCAGFVTMGSASMDYADEQFHNPFFHIIRHGVYLVLGVGVFAAMLRVPVAWWDRGAPVLLVIHPSVPANNLKELLDLARAKPGSLNYASAGAGYTVGAALVRWAF